MEKKKEIPKQFKNLFKTWDEYKEWCIQKSKFQLEQAFEKLEKNGNTNWKEKIKTNRWKHTR